MFKAKAAFEEIMETIRAQRNSDEAAYITLTHAEYPAYHRKISQCSDRSQVEQMETLVLAHISAIIQAFRHVLEWR
jgi:hypothetical protein